MNKPTQAQIETLRWIANQRDNENADLDDICTRADRALTAAAQVGGGIGSFPEDDPRRGAFHKLDPATIERCAQVAELYDDPVRIAAAIRRLKDAP